ncbi:MAG: hypothetical protein ACKVP0_09445 [Pirellulaceae bacterium]
MSNRRQQSPNRSFRRPDRQIRRMGVESLERRDCPAVMFELQGDLLRITGDQGPNVIEIYQPSDRVVEVSGDGVRHTFSGVADIVVDAQGGDDSVRSSKPKEIVVVGSKIKIDAGAGNDRIKIDDGGPTVRGGVYVAAADIDVDLGTGADELDLQMRHSDNLDLDLTAADGQDRILIGMLLPAVQKIRDAAARAELDLGGDSFVDVRMENVDNVNLSIVSAPTNPQPATGGNINVYWHVIRNGSSTAPRHDGVVILSSSLPGGNTGVSPSAFSFTATAGGVNAPSSASAAMSLGSRDDTVSILSRNLDDLNLDLATGGGNDTVEIDSRAGVGVLKSTDGGPTWNLNSLREFVAAAASAGTGRRHPDFLWNPVRVVASLDLGAGDDVARVQTMGVSDVSLNLTAGAGNDTLSNKLYVGGLSWNSPDTRLSLFAALGAGDDILSVDAAGFDDVDSFVDAGAGDDTIRYRMFSLIDRTRSAADRSRLNFFANLGSGRDSFDLETHGYDEIHSAISSGPAGEGRDSISVRHHSASRGRA